VKEHFVSTQADSPFLPSCFLLLVLPCLAVAAPDGARSRAPSGLSDGRVLPGVAVTLEGRAAPPPHLRPDAPCRRRASRRDYTASVDAPGSSFASRTATVGVSETPGSPAETSRLDLVLARAVSEQVIVSATAGRRRCPRSASPRDVLDASGSTTARRRRSWASCRRCRVHRAGGQSGLQASVFVRGGEVALRGRPRWTACRSTSRAAPSTSAPCCRSSSSASRSCGGRRAASNGNDALAGW